MACPLLVKSVMSTPWRFTTAVLFSALLGACGEASLQIDEPPPEQPEADDFTLTTGVMPLLSNETNHCTSCHNATALQSGLNLDATPVEVRNNLLAGGLLEQASYGQDINVDYPEQSLFVQAGLPGANFAHASQKFFQDEDDFSYKTLLGWVADGAPEN